MNKSCTKCAQQFEITDEDQKFYDKVSPVISGKKYLIPPPTLCPDCRQQRRLVFRNERNLYLRKCNLCGKVVISLYSAEKPHNVYCEDCFWSDKWDAINFGKDFDFSRPFFEQYLELLETVPIPAINMHGDNENSDYTNLSSNNKNCYLSFASSDNEDAYYSTYLQRSKNIADCFFIFDSELCYECVDCFNGYNLRYSQSCRACRDSILLFDCRSCEYCIGCAGLVNKKYYIFNKPSTKKEYEKLIEKIHSNEDTFDDAFKEFKKIKLQVPHKFYSGNNNQDISGDHISFSKNAHNCFDCTHLEDCKNCTWFHRAKDCQDCYGWGYPAELGYEIQLCGNNFYRLLFSAWCTTNISDLTYCYYCAINSKNLFACVSLHQKQYCVLNKQYSMEEYEKLVPRIIEHLIKTGEWGEFFPVAIAPFAYNESAAQEYFPLEKSAVLKMGSKWKDETLMTRYEGQMVHPLFDIRKVDDDIVNKILTCKTCKKNFKLIHQELELYRKLNVPVPKNCFNCRHKERLNLRNPRKLWDRNCAKCGAGVSTTYAPERPATATAGPRSGGEIVYCEKCYLKEVY